MLLVNQQFHQLIYDNYNDFLQFYSVCLMYQGLIPEDYNVINGLDFETVSSIKQYLSEYNSFLEEIILPAFKYQSNDQGIIFLSGVYVGDLKLVDIMIKVISSIYASLFVLMSKFTIKKPESLDPKYMLNYVLESFGAYSNIIKLSPYASTAVLSELVNLYKYKGTKYCADELMKILVSPYSEIGEIYIYKDKSLNSILFMQQSYNIYGNNRIKNISINIFENSLANLGVYFDYRWFVNGNF